MKQIYFNDLFYIFMTSSSSKTGKELELSGMKIAIWIPTKLLTLLDTVGGTEVDQLELLRIWVQKTENYLWCLHGRV